MESLVTALRAVHILAGMLALVVAPAAMLTSKGGRAHRRWGVVYVVAMGVVAATAIVLSAWRPNMFLGLVAVFSFYMAFTGRRVLARKRPERGERATALDWGATVVTAAASAGLVALGFARLAAGAPLGSVTVVLGGVGVAFAGRDLWRYARPPADPLQWWFDHMTAMLGSYIATVSAFSVVNFTCLPPTVRWLWPTALGAPLIAVWVTYYRARFRRRAGPASA
jgi:uncharacterized membrane protein